MDVVAEELPPQSISLFHQTAWLPLLLPLLGNTPCLEMAKRLLECADDCLERRSEADIDDSSLKIAYGLGTANYGRTGRRLS